VDFPEIWGKAMDQQRVEGLITVQVKVSALAAGR